MGDLDLQASSDMLSSYFSFSKPEVVIEILKFNLGIMHSLGAVWNNQKVLVIVTIRKFSYKSSSSLDNFTSGF